MPLTCTNPNSCHPILFLFGLTYIILFIALIAIPTFFDRSRRFRTVRGRRLDTLPRRTEPMPAFKEMDLEAGGVKDLEAGLGGEI